MKEVTTWAGSTILKYNFYIWYSWLERKREKAKETFNRHGSKCLLKTIQYSWWSWNMLRFWNNSWMHFSYVPLNYTIIWVMSVWTTSSTIFQLYRAGQYYWMEEIWPAVSQWLSLISHWVVSSRTRLGQKSYSQPELYRVELAKDKSHIQNLGCIE